MRLLAGLMLVGLMGAGASGAPKVPWLSAHLQCVQLSDDDGSRLTPLDSKHLAEEVAYANEVYKLAHVRFVFDPKTDIGQMRSTFLNSMVDSGPWAKQREAGNAAAAKYPGRFVIFFRYGPGKTPMGGSFSWSDLRFVASCGSNGWDDRYWNLAHEIGHNLGLPHPHGGPEFKTAAEAEKYFIEHGKDPNMFDGDGIADTPPFPAITDLYWADDIKTVTLAGVTFTIPRGDITSYCFAHDRSKNGPGLTPTQMRRVRWCMEMRLKGDGGLPTNAGIPQPIEAESLPITGSKDCQPSKQEMETFGAGMWSGGAQLFAGDAKLGSYVTLGFDVPKRGRYELVLGLTCAPDYGRIQVSVDGKPVGKVLDCYGPPVTASGPVNIGRLNLAAGQHDLKLEVVGQNEDSGGYLFGLDCLSLVPR